MSFLPAAHCSASARETKKKIWWQKVPQIDSAELVSALSG